jgi:hypothetical protein
LRIIFSLVFWWKNDGRVGIAWADRKTAHILTVQRPLADLVCTFSSACGAWPRTVSSAAGDFSLSFS